MFWIFKIFPDLFWPALILLGIISFGLSYLPQAKAFHLPIKILAATLVVAGIFVCGMLYSDRSWQAAAQELQLRVAQAEQQAQQTNETIRERVVTKLQVVKVRGEQNTRYIQQEVSKTNAGCTISPEFVQAHNRAAEQPK